MSAAPSTPRIALVTGGKTYAHLYLTGEDLKPVKVLSLALGV